MVFSSTMRRPRLFLGMVKGRMFLWEWSRDIIICRAYDKVQWPVKK